MENTAEKKNKGMKKLLLAAAALLVCAAAALALFTVRIGGRLYLRGDLIDARGAQLGAEEYEAAAAKRPGSVIRWSVPIGGECFDSFSEELTISSLPGEDVEKLAYFPELKRVDASACPDSASLAAAARMFPGLELVWSVDSSDGPIDGSAASLAVKKIGCDELRALIPLLPRLEAVDLRASAISPEQTDGLVRDFADVDFTYDVEFWGLSFPCGASELTIPEGAEGDADELLSALGRFKALERADLRGAHLTPCELRGLLPLCPEDTLFDIELLGLAFPSDAEEMDLSGSKVDSLEQIEAAAEIMPRLGKVIMSDCGVSDEEMDALDARHENVRFVWTVYFSVYALRTDATSFCASDLPNRGFVAPAATSEELWPLHYCRDLEALDLGHMFFKDLGFLEGLTKLRYLIIVEERFHDISVLGTLEELEYLEIFNNTIDDISPLLNCKKLRHLNIGYTRGYDPSPLAQMTWLERLWYPGQRIGADRAAEIIAALPDTQCYFPTWDKDGSTGGGWRQAEVYFEMRNAFGMFYQPGGTGMGKDA